MKKIKTPTLFLVLLLIIQSCTKDRVPDPTTLNTSQTTIVSENFDETSFISPSLPSGWSASPASGWQSDSSNFSTGYAAASGSRNLVISNDSVTNGDFILISKSFSTVHFGSITVTYSSRCSKHFIDNGSVISSFAYSTDEGTTWKNVPFTENPNDSNWYLINTSVRLSLPAAANQASVKFRWVAHLKATPSGSYRIDDFQVLGTSM